MAEYTHGPYFIKRKKNGRGGKAAAALVLVLLLLTAGIILLSVFLPRRDDESASTAPVPAGRKLYCLVSGETNNYTTALLMAQECSARGGAGYLFNDGTFRAVAAVYANEADARDLATVNEGSSYFTLAMPSAALSGSDSYALEYALGDFFDTLYSAATELDRGNMTDSAADCAVAAACRKLGALSASVENAMLRRAFETASAYAPAEDKRSLLSYVRYVHVRAIVQIYYALGG